MSNQVYGYALLRTSEDIEFFANAASRAAETVGLGLNKISDSELFNFPDNRMPKETHLSFRITDNPKKNTASYLVDFETYAPEADIGLPHNARKRLELLVRLTEMLASLSYVKEVNVAITDCEEIEEIVRVSLRSFGDRLVADMEKAAPPNKLYIVK